MASRKRIRRAPRTEPQKAASKLERALFARYAAGDERARDEIIRLQTPWVVNIAKKYSASFPSVGIMELVAEGNRGLLEAVGRYRVSRGKTVKFSTYAWFWILKFMQEHITSQISIIGIPARLTRDMRLITRQLNRELASGRPADLNTVARALDMDPASARELVSEMRNIGRVDSLDRSIDMQDSAHTLKDVVEDGDGDALQQLQELSENLESRHSMSELLGHLKEHEREVIRLRFGFLDGQYYSFKEISETMGIPPAKVKDIEHVALIKLRRLKSVEL